MQNRTVPRHINTIIKEINGQIQHPEYKLALSVAVVRLTLDDLITPFTSKDETHTMAEWIALSGNQEVLDWLYQRMEENPLRYTHLLPAAIVCGQPKKTIERLVKFDYTDFNGYTPLHLAVLVNNNNMVSILDGVARKANTGQIDLIGRHYSNQSRETPFSTAAANGNLTLINKGLLDVDSNYLPEPHIAHCIHTGLLNAIRAGHDDVADAIISRLHKDLIDQECQGDPDTALFAAAEKGNQHCIQSLASHAIEAYIKMREAEAKKYTRQINFILFKTGVGYPIDAKISAAKALQAVVMGTATRDMLAAHEGPLGTKRLKALYDTVKKFYLDAYIPEADNKACATKRS